MYSRHDGTCCAFVLSENPVGRFEQRDLDFVFHSVLSKCDSVKIRIQFFNRKESMQSCWHAYVCMCVFVMLLVNTMTGKMRIATEFKLGSQSCPYRGEKAYRFWYPSDVI